MEKLKHLQQQYLSKVLNSKAQQFLPYDRAIFLYHEIEEISTISHVKFRGWLAVLSAEKVLPILIPALPEYIDHKIPLRMINLAKRLCREQLKSNSWRIALFEDMYYHLSGGGWGHIDDSHVSLAAHLAGISAHRALGECKGEKPLSKFDSEFIQTLLNTSTPENSYLDTAGVASVAFSMQDGDTYSKEYMKEFWIWWFTDAIDTAYDYTTSN